jgi:hypothetical protein
MKPILTCHRIIFFEEDNPQGDIKTLNKELFKDIIRAYKLKKKRRVLPAFSFCPGSRFCFFFDY